MSVRLQIGWPTPPKRILQIIAPDFEEWRTIDENPLYEVSSFGRVRRGTKILKPARAGGGGKYRRVFLWKDAKSKARYVHRLVADAFLGGCRSAVVHHRNEDPTDNKAENLKVVSVAENTAHFLTTR